MADLREWLRDIERLGELEKIDGVDWDLELAVLAELANEKFGAQVLDERIRRGQT